MEVPASRILADLEARQGIGDNETELLIRWLWKIAGLFWVAFHPEDNYSGIYSLTERVTRPLDDIRGRLVLALSLVEKMDPHHGDKPLGLDSAVSETDAIFVSGVFSKTALMVLLEDFAHLVPGNFSMHKLARKPDPWKDAKLIHPKVGFRNDNEAVYTTMVASRKLQAAHERLARKNLPKQ